MKWLNCTPETTCNNRYIVQPILIISEYSIQLHFNASQNIKLRARIDLIMMLWLLVAYVLLSLGNVQRFTCEHTEFYGAEIHTQL